MVFRRIQVLVLMSSAGTFTIFAEILRRDLLETLKLGLYPATSGFFSEKIGACFEQGGSENSTRFSASSRSKYLSLQFLPERLTVYCVRYLLKQKYHQLPIKPGCFRYVQQWLRHGSFLPEFRRAGLSKPVPPENYLCI